MINEILKINDFHPILLDIINQVYVSKKGPLEWLMSVLIPVFKKGDSTDPNNYTGIALMCVCAKLYNKLLLIRLRSVLDNSSRYLAPYFQNSPWLILFTNLNIVNFSGALGLFILYFKIFISY